MNDAEQTLQPARAGTVRRNGAPIGNAGPPSARLLRSTFDEMPGWRDDDHARAFRAFRATCPAILDRARNLPLPSPLEHGLAAICRQALSRGEQPLRRAEARLFFERLFVPHVVEHQAPHGLLTGYYEPVVEGSRTPGGRFRVPLYRRPPDLENVVAETERARTGVPLTHMRRTSAGLVPFPTRTEIEAGALAGQGLELLWLADPVDRFFAQVQGSVRVRLPDGALVGLTYDGKNGHPYTSIGRVLIERGEIGAGAMSMQALGDWLRADEARGRALMAHNASFVFFRETDGTSALGALGTPLVPGRSLAVDPAHVPLGLPVFVAAPGLRHWGGRGPLQRLMVAQDVGSAIRGPERGDIYFGAGEQAGQRAGITKHACRFHLLVPRDVIAGGRWP